LPVLAAQGFWAGVGRVDGARDLRAAQVGDAGDDVAAGGVPHLEGPAPLRLDPLAREIGALAEQVGPLEERAQIGDMGVQGIGHGGASVTPASHHAAPRRLARHAARGVQPEEDHVSLAPPDLSDAYANAAHIPGGAEFPARWAASAAAFRARHPPEDIPYGAHPRERLDLFRPPGTPRA
jgi:hypothetical protein